MKLSTKGRYGLRATVDLAVYSEKKESVSISCIAQRENISESYLEQLAGKLKKAGLIKSTRGAQGGYRLGETCGRDFSRRYTAGSGRRSPWSGGLSGSRS